MYMYVRTCVNAPTFTYAREIMAAIAQPSPSLPEEANTLEEAEVRKEIMSSEQSALCAMNSSEMNNDKIGTSDNDKKENQIEEMSVTSDDVMSVSCEGSVMRDSYEKSEASGSCDSATSEGGKIESSCDNVTIGSSKENGKIESSCDNVTIGSSKEGGESGSREGSVTSGSREGSVTSGSLEGSVTCEGGVVTEAMLKEEELLKKDTSSNPAVSGEVKIELYGQFQTVYYIYSPMYIYSPIE